MLRGCSAASLCSLRNRSDQATSGRQNKKFTPSTIDDHHHDRQEHVAELRVAARRPRRSCRCPGARTMLVDRDRFRCGEEEPAAAEAHHPVPDEPDHRARHVELPEPLPLRQPHQPRGLVELARLGDQRVVEAERHVPRLRREDREDRRALQAEDRVREQRDEEGHRDRQEARGSAPTAGCRAAGSSTFSARREPCRRPCRTRT